jgi:BirA family biotin operon repressor/biotin-[acetyl-CoA-carboxylase] ligase
VSSSFDVIGFHELRTARGVELGSAIWAFESTASTNDLALAAARAGEPHGLVIVADTQTEGRGRQGRVWHSPAGENLLVSILLRPELPVADAPLLALAVGLALRAAVVSFVGERSDLGIKWPNDLLCAKKKLAGILIETQVQGGELLGVVTGVGLNLGTRVFPTDISGTATSLSLLGAVSLSREAVLVSVLAEVERAVRTLQTGGRAALVPELVRYDVLRGRRVDVDGVAGRAEGIDMNGRLLVRDSLGHQHALVSGHVIVEGDESDE